MPNFGMFPQTQVLLAQATVTTTGSSAAIVIPSASSYRLVAQVNTVSGTLPTLVIGVATSADAGVTYDTVLTSTSATTSGVGVQIAWRPYLGIGDAATSTTVGLLGTGNAPASVLVNGPVNPQFIKIAWIISGTTPSISFNVRLYSVPQDLSD